MTGERWSRLGAALAVTLVGGRGLAATPEPSAAEAAEQVATPTPAEPESALPEGADALAPQEPEPAPPEAGAAEDPPDAARERLDALEERLNAVERENQRLRDEVELLREDQDWTSSRVDQVMPLTTRVSGYVDVGFFYVSGDGRGIESDFGNEHFPEYAYVNGGTQAPMAVRGDSSSGSWVFMGDPLSTAINSRGDPADVTDSRAVTLNPIRSNGKASFIVNNVNLALQTSPWPELSVFGLVDFLPRSRDVSVKDEQGLGDYLDVKLAQVEWRPALEAVSITLAAGKVESLLGHEYRVQEAPSRLTVTPSLLCRYTCGRPVGVRATAGLLDDDLEFGVALTNGSSVIEGFPFGSETDTNQFKTLSGRALYRFDVGAGLVLGVSGAWGAQDFQQSDFVLQRHIGGQVHLEVQGLEVTGEYARGDAQGEDDPAVAAPCATSACLRFQAAYGLVGYRFTNWLVPYARVDWRDALHRSGASFVYVSDLVRATMGVRLEASSSLAAKLEYTANRELGRIPEFPNDVYTSSLVGRF